MLTLDEILEDFRSFHGLDEEAPLDVQTLAPGGDSPLHLMAVMGDHNAISLLATVGADVNLANGAGNTPMHLAVYGQHLTAVRALLRAGADASRRNDAGHTAAELAREQQAAPLINLFFALEAGQALPQEAPSAPGRIELSTGPEAAYLYLPAHPGPGKTGQVARQLALHTLIQNYQGPELYLDLDASGHALGIEIVPD